MDWLLDLVGTPYKRGGKTPREGLDCYGLAFWVVKQLDLPAHEGEGHEFQWRRLGQYIGRKCVLQRYDCLLFTKEVFNTDITIHVGIMVNRTDFIHATSQLRQVSCEPADRYPFKTVWRPTLDNRNRRLDQQG